MRTTLDLPDPLMRELKARAAMEGVKRKDYFAAIVRDALQKPSALAAAQVGSQVPVSTRKRIKKLPSMPALSNRQISALLDASDSAPRRTNHDASKCKRSGRSARPERLVGFAQRQPPAP